MILISINAFSTKRQIIYIYTIVLFYSILCYYLYATFPLKPKLFPQVSMKFVAFQSNKNIAKNSQYPFKRFSN